MERIRNARGNEVELRPVTAEEIIACGGRIARRLSATREILGVMAIGSCAYGKPDAFSDLDLRVFGQAREGLVDRICEICTEMGGKRDDDATTIHFPLDSPAYLFDGLCVEFEVLDPSSVDEQIEDVLNCKQLDAGLMHALRTGQVLFDRHGDITRLQERLGTLPYPEKYLDWIRSVALDCPMKLLIQSVHRGDYAQAMEWLVKFYYDCLFILFARNAQFFPGRKRALLQTVRQLPHVPEGFCEFWEKVLSSGVSDRQQVIDYAHGLVNELK
ncbi:MAG TPA: hypothetical protein HPP83_12500 [Candidatus Hydrogenedentes bacterium]|nr:hypothetical protein [Candidatus Hydrogenedentota bacterium]